jgi:hypothetical protein
MSLSLDDVIVLHLEKIAAEAKLLAEQVRNRKHWPGDIQQGLQSIGRDLAAAKDWVGHDRNS